MKNEETSITKNQMQLSPVYVKILLSFLILGTAYYLFYTNAGLQQFFYSSSFWFNDKFSRCQEDCEIEGRIFLNIITPAMSSNYQSLDNWIYKIELKRADLFITTSSSEDISPSKICIDKITLNGKSFFEEPICNKANGLSIQHSFEDLLTQPSVTDGIISGVFPNTGEMHNENFNIMLYPFTQFDVPANIQFHYYIETDQIREEGTIHPGLYIETNDYLNWNITIDETDDLISKEKSIDTNGESKQTTERVTKLQIHASAPNLYKLLTIVLFTVLFALICFLFSLSDTSVFIQGITALLFGIYSIKQIILPKAVLDTYTTIDFLFFTLYIFLFYVILDHFFNRLAHKPFFTKSISNKIISTRTSQLFHKHNCNYSQNIKEGNIIFFRSRKDAVEAGKIPCSHCWEKK